MASPFPQCCGVHHGEGGRIVGGEWLVVVVIVLIRLHPFPSAVAYIMEKVDVVLVGAEGVVENGGIINKIGTYGVAIAAKTLNKPFYVAAESFKFTRLFPLSQSDLPDECKYKGSSLRRAAAVDANAGSQKDSQQQQQHPRVDLEQEHPLVDYTPPDYITLLFTDLGVLTPTAVSDHLIDLYL